MRGQLAADCGASCWASVRIRRPIDATDVKFAGVMARSGISTAKSPSTANTRLVMSSEVRPTSAQIVFEPELAIDRAVLQEALYDIGNPGFRV
jgi:hypothetical protein